MLFIQNRYYARYYRIIQHAQQRKTTDTYTEIHHILPRSMGGTDDADNLVSLTAREHLVCHMLLPKFTSGDAQKSMYYAIHRMTNKSDGEKIKTSRLFEFYRKMHSLAVSEDKRNDPNNGFKKTKGMTHAEIFGVERSQEIRDAIRKSNSTRGISQQTKDKIAATQKQRYENNPKLRVKKPFTAEHKENLRLARVALVNSGELIYNWTHPVHGDFTGTRQELKNAYPDHKIRISELGKVIDPNGNVSSHRQWRLK